MLINFFELATKGGWLMAVLFILSIIAVTLFIERLITTKKATSFEEKTYIEILRMIDQKKTEEAFNICKLSDSTICKILEEGISYAASDINLATETIEQSASQFIRSLEKNLGTISTLAAIGPLIGFLGTVTGMIRVFITMAANETGADIQTLSGGIYEAMITTVGGLIVGIICIVFHNLLVSRIEAISFTIEAKITQVNVHLRRMQP